MLPPVKTNHLTHRRQQGELTQTLNASSQQYYQICAAAPPGSIDISFRDLPPRRPGFFAGRLLVFRPYLALSAFCIAAKFVLGVAPVGRAGHAFHHRRRWNAVTVFIPGSPNHLS
jgi:hypothetical protein